MRPRDLRGDHADLGAAQGGKRMDLRAGNPRMQDVADDRDPQRRKILLVVADGEHVEQALRRVRMAAVARVDHVDVGPHVAGDQIRRTARAVAEP